MLDSTSLQTICPRCEIGFIPSRSNQKFCSRICQKTSTQNATRIPRTTADSAEERRRQGFRAGRLKGLSDAFYDTLPTYRAAFMVALIAEARVKAELRKCLTKRELLRVWNHHPGTGRLHIAHCLDHFCGEVYGLRSYIILDPKTPLPCEEETAFPSIYQGPDVPPVYEDGSLKRRACPWTSRPKTQPTRSSKVPSNSYDWRKIARSMNDHGWQRYIGQNHADDDAPAHDCLTQQS